MIDNRFNSLKEAMTGTIATKNKKGFMFKELSVVSKQYIEYSKTCNRVLEIGCAYGITVLPLLDLEKVTVHAIDLSSEHIDILKSKLTPSQSYYFVPMVGEFPISTDYDNNLFDAIHISNVFHFIKGEHFNLALKKCFNWLKPQGKVFINTCSLYMPYVNDFIPTYESRKKVGVEWPGEITNMQDYIPKNLPPSELNPQSDFFHIFTKEDIEEKISNNVFTIEKSHYYFLENADYFKDFDNSRTSIGIIANKS